MIAWDKIFQPKCFGGLGLRKTEAVNLAFQAKLAWKIVADTKGLWTDIIKHKYLRLSTLFDCKPKSTDSSAWRSILRSRVINRKGIRWKVGNGKTIRFWWDNWIANDNLVDLLGLEVATITNPHPRVCEVITSDHCWDVKAIRFSVNHEDIVQKIIGIPLPQFLAEDSFCWGLMGSGVFSTKIATWAAHNNFHANDPKWRYNWLWKLDVMPKIKIFLWQKLTMPYQPEEPSLEEACTLTRLVLFVGIISKPLIIYFGSVLWSKEYGP